MGVFDYDDNDVDQLLLHQQQQQQQCQDGLPYDSMCGDVNTDMSLCGTSFLYPTGFESEFGSPSSDQSWQNFCRVSEWNLADISSETEDGIPSYETSHQRRGSGSAVLSLHAPPLFPPTGALSLPPQLPPPPPLHSSSNSGGLQGMVGAGVGSSNSSSNNSNSGGGGGGPGVLGAGPGPGAGDGGRVMVHWTQSGASVQSTSLPPDRVVGRQSGGDEDDDLSDDDDELLTPAPPRERLSYTRYQLELLNGIYISVRYPNSVQKQLIAKRVGISREQVKIWFQNRRRKDVVTSKTVPAADSTKSPPSSTTSNQDPASPTTSSCSSPPTQPATSKASDGNTQDNGRKSPDAEGQSSSDGGQKTRMVPDAVVQGCISELKRFSDEKLKERKDKRKAKGKRRNHASAASAAARTTHSALQGVAAAGNSSQPIGRLFQAYDMVAPPNKVTPTAAAYLNTSSNRFNHSHNTSAFSNPRDYLTNASSMPRLAWDTGLDSSPLSQSLGGGVVADSLAHSRAFGGLGMTGLGMGLMPMSQVTSGAGVTHGSIAGTPQESLPALTDLLSYTHAANFRHQMEAASNSSRDAHGAPLPPPPSHPPSLFSSSSATNGAGNHASLPDLGSSSRHNGVVPPAPPPPPPPASPFGLSRVYPFPFIADPPIMLSSLHQQDPLRHHAHPAWPRPHPSPPTAHFNPMATMNGIDPYKPVVISSFSNPFFPHPTNPSHWPHHPGTDPTPPGGSGFS